MFINSSAIVLFSGGQDSTTCLAWALQKFKHVETIGFDYRQRHSVELQCRKQVLAALSSSRLGEDHLLDLKILSDISDTALTSDSEIKLLDTGLPNTFVPGRNLLFFTLATALAYRRGIHSLIGGMCETDYSGYPDCRRSTLDSLQTTLALGTKQQFLIHTPLMYLDKAAIWWLSDELKVLDLVVEYTHTCYVGNRSDRHPWGYGCNECPACKLRSAGWEKYQNEILRRASPTA